MNDWAKLEQQARRYQSMYPEGTRIMLLSMDDPYAKIPSGTRGTVDFVDDIGTVFVNWDNGSHLGVVPGEDSFRKLTQEELEAEQNTEDESEDEGTEEESGPSMSM